MLKGKYQKGNIKMSSIKSIRYMKNIEADLSICREYLSWILPVLSIAQKMKFLIKDFFSKFDQIRRNLVILKP